MMIWSNDFHKFIENLLELTLIISPHQQLSQQSPSAKHLTTEEGSCTTIETAAFFPIGWWMSQKYLMMTTGYYGG